jgi:hypothetical protein
MTTYSESASTCNKSKHLETPSSRSCFRGRWVAQFRCGLVDYLHHRKRQRRQKMADLIASIPFRSELWWKPRPNASPASGTRIGHASNIQTGVSKPDPVLLGQPNVLATTAGLEPR